MKRVIYTFATGSETYKTMAKGLALSLELQDSKTPRLLLTDEVDHPELTKLYQEIVPPHPDYKHWFSKFAGLELTDADQILFIDSDCLAVKNPDELFDKLQGIPFAVQGEWTEGHAWWGDFAGAMKKLGLSKAVTLNAGFLYYERTEETKRLFAEIMRLYGQYEELGLKRLHGNASEEPCIGLAMATTGVGVAFPNSADFSVTTWYKMGKVHLDVLQGECAFIEAKYKPILCRPYFYHSAMTKWDLRYWIQLRRLVRVFNRFPGWPRKPDGLRIRIYRRGVAIVVKAYRILAGV